LFAASQPTVGFAACLSSRRNEKGLQMVFVIIPDNQNGHLIIGSARYFLKGLSEKLLGL
jgi:hypothetical protein